MRRRAALIGVSAAATLALGGTMAACGGEGGKPYVAVGTEPTSATAVPPSGKVELVPLDGAGAGGSAARRDGKGRVPTLPQALEEQGGPPAPSGTTAHSGGTKGSGGGTALGARRNSSTGGTAGGGTTRTPSGNGGSASADTTGSTGTTGGAGGSTPTPSRTPTPAALTLGPPTRTPTPTRRCETVTVPVRNTGDTPVRSGTLAFATHVIGLLGIDWASVVTEQPLAPVPAHTATSRTYTVCLDAWRVPPGTHIETRSVTADWR